MTHIALDTLWLHYLPAIRVPPPEPMSALTLYAGTLNSRRSKNRRIYAIANIGVPLSAKATTECLQVDVERGNQGSVWAVRRQLELWGAGLIVAEHLAVVCRPPIPSGGRSM